MGVANLHHDELSSLLEILPEGPVDLQAIISASKTPIADSPVSPSRLGMPNMPVFASIARWRPVSANLPV